MNGISSKAAGGLENNKKYIGNELQHNEFTDGSGLKFYDFNARTYDQQLGRFIQLDPLSEEQDQESWSPFHYSYNNPIIFSDPDGELPIIPYAAYRVVRALIYLASPKGNGFPIRFYLKQTINDNTTIVATLPLLMPKKVVAPDKTEDGGFFSRKLKSVSKEAETESKSTTNTKKDRVLDQKSGEKAQNQTEGIEKAQDKAKKEAPSGEKQNKIKSVKKSEQNLKNELKNVKSLKDVIEKF